MAIGSRMQYQYQGSLPKEFLMGLARERNRVGLGVGRGLNQNHDMAGQIIGGVKLPAEKYCLTGVGWGMREEWDSEGEEGIQVSRTDGFGGEGVGEFGDSGMGMEIGEEEGDEDAEATMEDIFGDGAGGEAEDEDMQDG